MNGPHLHLFLVASHAFHTYSLIDTSCIAVRPDVLLTPLLPFPPQRPAPSPSSAACDSFPRPTPSLHPRLLSALSP